MKFKIKLFSTYYFNIFFIVFKLIYSFKKCYFEQLKESSTIVSIIKYYSMYSCLGVCNNEVTSLILVFKIIKVNGIVRTGL